MIMKALIYSPYWNSFGGGERFVASVASYLEDVGFKVKILSADVDLISKIEKRFGIKLTNSVVINKGLELFGRRGGLIRKLVYYRPYDLAIFVSDGSVPMMLAKNNILLMQAPFKINKGVSFVNGIKMRFIDSVICYTNYTKKLIDTSYGVKSKVVYPPVTGVVGKKRKRKVILSVGRFDNLMHDKRQDVLISAFKKIPF